MGDYTYERGKYEEILGRLKAEAEKGSATDGIGIAVNYILFLDTTGMASGNTGLLEFALDFFDSHHIPGSSTYKDYAGCNNLGEIIELYKIAKDVAMASGLEEKSRLMGKRIAEIDKCAEQPKPGEPCSRPPPGVDYWKWKCDPDRIKKLV